MAYYRDVLGFTVLSPPYVMDGDAIRADMGELLDDPAMKAAIVGFGDDGDRVLEVIEYLRADGGDARREGLADRGLTHVGLICDDLGGPGKRWRTREFASWSTGSPISRACAPRGSPIRGVWSSSSSRRASPSVRISRSFGVAPDLR